MINASEVIATVKLKLQSTPVDSGSFSFIVKSEVLDSVKIKLQARQSSLLNPSSVISNVRESLGDTVAPYRWSDSSLDSFLQLGIDDIKQRRDDSGTVSDSFAPALYFYVLARAYDADSGISDNNTALSQINDKRYLENLNSVLYFYSDSTLNDAIDEGIVDIKQKRSDANYSYAGSVLASSQLRDSFFPALCFYVLARAYSDNNVNFSQEQDKRYLENLSSVLYFYPETILLDAINNGIQEVLRFRPDAALTETGLLRDAEIVEVIDGLIDLPVVFKNAIINFTAYEAVLGVKNDAGLAETFLSIFNKEIRE